MNVSGTLRVFCMLALAGPAWSADFSDPTWPCVQRKVERLSVGLMWPHPIEDVTLDDAAEDDIDTLVGRLTLRRVPVEETADDITGFAARNGGSAALMGQVFDRAFDQLAGTRRTIIGGIEDYSLSQIALSERIETARRQMDEIMAQDDPDFDRVDSLEEQIDWDERIYDDRRRSLTYVCETPVLLEKRLYSIAQMLSQAIEEG